MRVGLDIVAAACGRGPDVGARKPVIIFIVVDLPAPLGRESPALRPCATAKIDSRHRRVSGRNVSSEPSISIMGSDRARAWRKVAGGGRLAH